MRTLQSLLPVLLFSLVAGAPHTAGGPPMASLVRLPTHFVSGEAVTLGFDVYQHGRPTGLWTGRVYIGGRQASVVGDHWGRYTATATPTEIGNTEVQILLGDYGAAPSAAEGADTRQVFRIFHRLQLLPIPTVARGEAPPVVSAVDRGRALFIAKGCNACHTHADAGRAGGGRDLTGRAFSDDYLRAVIANPYSVFGEMPQFGGMPTLVLDDAELDALVAFLRRAPLTAVR